MTILNYHGLCQSFISIIFPRIEKNVEKKMLSGVDPL